MGAAPLFAALAVAPAPLPDPPSAGDPIELRWEAPPGCPDEDAVRQRVARWSPAPDTMRRVRADARVRAEGDTLVLELQIDDGLRSESRRVRSRDCDALARATGLVIAVAIDPLGVASTLREPPGDAAPPIEPAPPPSPQTRPVQPSPETERRAPARDREAPAPPRVPIRLGIRPELLVGGGLLPGVIGLGVGGTLAVFGRARPWRAELGGAYWFPRRATVVDVPSAGGDIWLAHARGSGCGVPSLRRVEFPICAGVDVGAAGGTGFGAAVATRTNADVFVGLHGGVGVAWAPIPAIALFARVEAIAGLRRPGFLLEGVGTTGEVHRVGAAGARGAFGVEVRFFR